MTFRVGQLVVCVASGWRFMGQDTAPYKGQVLTIRTISHAKGQVFLRFEEIVNQRRKFEGCWPWQKKECYFNSVGFRPVVTPSIEIFTAMLTPSKQSERV